ncbi:hypothetical protein DL96DRAFT_1305775 [Flagelloscypha sp. PMI_526]|nr:hypothetical protein DL96DRAFT_1305775 [Flagelloscypha sp. PMI_526]
MSTSTKTISYSAVASRYLPPSKSLPINLKPPTSTHPQRRDKEHPSFSPSSPDAFQKLWSKSLKTQRPIPTPPSPISTIFSETTTITSSSSSLSSSESLNNLRHAGTTTDIYPYISPSDKLLWTNYWRPVIPTSCARSKADFEALPMWCHPVNPEDRIKFCISFSTIEEEVNDMRRQCEREVAEESDSGLGFRKSQDGWWSAEVATTTKMTTILQQKYLLMRSIVF